MKRLISFAFLIGLALYIFILTRLDLLACWEKLKQVNPWLILLAIGFGVPEVLFKSLRLRSFVVKAKSHISLKHAVLSFLSGQPLASITPGKLGDVSRIVLLGRYGKIPMSTALAVHAADRIYDLASIVLLAVVGLASFTSGFAQGGPAVGTIIGMLAGMFLILALLNPRWLKFILKPLVMSLLSKKLAGDLSHHAKEFYAKLHALLIPSFKIFGPFVLSFLAWESAIMRSFILAMALGLPLSYFKFALLLPVMIVVELLPISILGFGPREAALFMLFTADNLHREDLAVFSLLMALSILITALIGIPAAARMIPKRFEPHDPS
jgi:glycosyltransferase 2 family protein